ncbi:serine/threonine protein kinase [bacterium]|nr:serine/threonine protein kinase [bacterium]
MALPQRWSQSLGSQEVEHLRRRIRVYALVMLGVDVVAYLSDYVTPLFIEGLETAEYPGMTLAVRWASTIGLALAWASTRFSRVGHAGLVAIETLMTVGLTLVYVHVAAGTMDGDVAGYAAVFAMFGIMLFLSVRAAVVPSPAWRTAGIGVISVACLYVFGRSMFVSLGPQVLDGVNFIAVAIILATSVTSHVIYGLRRKVREALQLGQYTLEEKLGEGGMGAVYRARHAMLRRQAAIKLIRQDGPSHPESLQRFEREANVTASLQSPQTVQLFDYGVSEDGAVYYVMELLEGIDLETAVARFGPMPPARVCHLLRQACASLAEAHSVGLVHRDVKPANLMLCQYGLQHDFLKVLDFGLVGLGDGAQLDDVKLTSEGLVRGTPAYLAPEMASRTHTVDGRADIYGLGCVAYQLLTGSAPFERKTAMATVLAHVNDAPQAPSAASELEIPAAMDALILACLAKDPADRPGSALELERRLAAAVDPRGWDDARAEDWWRVHRPSRQSEAGGGREELKVTLDLRGRGS